MKRLCVVFFLSLCRTASAQAVLSEIMFNPRGNENAYEFMEIYNTSATVAVSLRGWKIGDQIETDLLISPDSLYSLAPGQFAVILDPNYFQSPAVYDSLIPASALILTIDDNSFGSGGLSNSTAETVVLQNAAGQTVARYTYSLDNADGIADEKIFLNADDSPVNWANSRRVDGTPGQSNSVTPRRVDGALVASSFSISPAVVREGQTAKLGVTLRNRGLQALTAATVEFSIIKSTANVTLPLRLGNASLRSPLSQNDSLGFDFEWSSTIAGRHDVLIRLVLAGDEDHTNDSLRASIAVGFPRRVVFINEIMFAPPAAQPEWVELFNAQDAAVPLADWVLQDESNTRAVIKNKISLPPRSYRVLAASSSLAATFNIPDSLVIVLDNFPTLNNSGDILLLRDFSGAVIDSAAYQPNWGATGIAAEKIWFERENVTANWQPSRDARGGTPGTLNSVSPRENDLAIIRLRFDPAAPRANESVQLIATIRNAGRRPSERFIVTLAHDRNHDDTIQSGEEIGRVEVNQSMLPEDSILVRQTWPQPPSGRNRLLATITAALDAETGNNLLAGKFAVGYPARSVVINEIYYAPRSGEAEWVEFYNRSAQPVDLAAWRWRDADASAFVALPDSAPMLAPGAFALFAAGRNVAFADPDANVMVPKNWLTLNNDRETLVLMDFHGRMQDSLSFSSKWGGDTGIALERINPNLAGNDSSNWSSSVATSGSTPGQRNSIFTEVIPARATIAVAPQPFSPDGDGHDDFAVIQFQVPATTATAEVKIFDVRGRLVHHLLSNTPVGATHEVLWNGRNENNEPLPTGIYIVYLQAIQPSGGVLVEARTTLVLARRLK